MRVRNDFSYDVQKRQGKRDIGFSKFSFGADAPAPAQPAQNIQPEQNAQESKKKGITFKKATNFLAGFAFLAAIAATMRYAVTRPSVEKAAKTFEKTSKILKEMSESTELSRELGKTKTSFMFKAGLSIKKWKGMGEELLNNLVYGFGTVVVMPLVILFSPIGKKKASKEDKIFTVIRQPLSFGLLFPMQLTVDKFFKELVPKLVDKNTLEDKDADGKIIQDQIKFNTKAIKKNAKNEIKELLESKCGLKGSQLELVDDLMANLPKDLDDFGKYIKEALPVKNLEHKSDEIVEVLGKRVVDFSNNIKLSEKRTKLLALVLTIGGNVLFSAPVGCTTLNVVYGSLMKGIGGKIAKPSAKKGGE